MPTAISRGQSTPRMALAMMLGLLFATMALYASPTNANVVASPLCKDDLQWTFEKNGENCDWIKSLPEKKRKKVCKRKNERKGTSTKKIKKFCPVACDACKKTNCPKKFKKGNTEKKCSKYQPGLTCESNYKYTGGCGADDPINCVAIDTYTCGDNKKWSLSTLDVAGCVTDSGDGPLFPSGETCDPAECPLAPPKAGTDCDLAQLGLTCESNYKYTGGCGADDPINCNAIDTYTCEKDLKWSRSTLNVAGCVTESGDGPLFPSGETCDPAECPLALPEPWTDCDLAPTHDQCAYNYQYFGCTFETLQCYPSAFASCNEEKKWEIMISGMQEPCLGMDEGIPFGDTCEPCSEVKPEDTICPSDRPTAGKSCDIGVDCEYDFGITGCDALDLQCTAASIFACFEGVWLEAVTVPLPCFQECPLALPKDGTDCYLAPTQDACEYNYQYVGCSFESGLSCFPHSYASCNDEKKWETKELASDPCQGMDAGLPFGATCEPCSEVKPEDTICPSDRPTAGKLCEISNMDCKYDFGITGCSASDLQCTAASFFSCFEGVWEEFVVDPEPCLPAECPLALPKVGTDCQFSEEKCAYDYQYVGCTFEYGLQCVPHAYASCNRENMWETELLFSLPCPGMENGIPFGETCEPCSEVPEDPICPSDRPTAGKLCGSSDMDCEYDSEISGCSASDLQCTAASFFSCFEGVWVPGLVVVETLPCLPPLPAECPLAIPKAGTDCQFSEEKCAYDYQYIGCTFEYGLQCVAHAYASCNRENMWETEFLASMPCPGMEKGMPFGETCRPCSEVKPEDTICPSDRPTAGKLCGSSDIRDCEYDFGITGCSASDLQCTAASIFACIEGVWLEAVVDPLPCLPPLTRKCPDSKPSDYACMQNGYEVGLVCNYDYRNTSCEEGKEVCSSLETYECSEYGWLEIARDFFCLEPPKDFLNECDPPPKDF